MFLFHPSLPPLQLHFSQKGGVWVISDMHIDPDHVSVRIRIPLTETGTK
ncbi:hypothetical protein A2U01_0094484 [Trifolium medium]|uniref:Uncharacterized protein n=1 Tax=Trifolium medium TaxID=97028 RepID=A0A392ULG8_9FABA|nr:hypothetical protein [Trifolium medium]